MATVRHLGLFPVKVIGGPCVIKDAETLPSGPETETGPGTFRPIGMKLEEVMALYWRVKSWKFEHTRTEQEEIVPAAFGPNTEPANEKDLVCGYSVNELSAFVVTQVMNNFPDQIENGKKSSAIFEIFNYYQNGPYILKKDNLFYPNINIAWESEETNISPNPGDAPLGSSSIQGENDVQFGQQDIVVLGKTYSIPMYFSEMVGEIDGSEYFYHGEISVNEYWPYDPNDSLGPIYDKTTGKQLRAFPDSSASASASVS